MTSARGIGKQVREARERRAMRQRLTSLDKKFEAAAQRIEEAVALAIDDASGYVQPTPENMVDVSMTLADAHALRFWLYRARSQPEHPQPEAVTYEVVS